MKRKYADRANWRRVLDRKYKAVYCKRPDFEGYVAVLYIGRVRDPLSVTYGGRSYRIADAGFTWVQHFPDGCDHVLTTMYDHEGKVVQWYIDICKTKGVTDNGVPWFDDLYLDIVILPGGELFVLDADELQEALDNGHITEEDFARAHAEVNRITTAYYAGTWTLLDKVGRSIPCLDRLSDNGGKK